MKIFERALLATFLALPLGCDRAAVQKVEAADLMATVTPEEVRALEVDVTALAGRAFTSRIEATGKALPVRESLLSSEVPGTIQKIYVKEGERVEQGAALLRFDQTGFRLSVEQATAALAAAKTQVAQLELELARVRQLVGAEAAPQATADQISAKYEGALAQAQMANVGLKQARKALGNSTLRAPYDGTIAAIIHEKGEFAPSMPQTMLVKIVDTSSLEVQVFLAEETADSIEVGQKAEIEVESAGVKTQGEIIFVSNRLNPGSQTYEVRVRLDNPEDRIKGGAFTRVGLVRKSVSDAILIPLRSVQRGESGEPYVFVAEGKIARRVGIRVGESSGDQVHALSGLAAGQRLITSQVSELEDGHPIVPRVSKH